MKIAVTGTRGFPGVQGGIENHCEQLYTHLAENGCYITVFIRTPYIAPNLHTYRGVSLIPVSCPQNKYLEAFVHTFKSILKARSLKPDILHIHAIGPSVFTPLARLLGMKVVVTHHGPDYKRQKWSLPAKIFLRFCEWIGMTCANEIITITQDISDNIKSKFGRWAAVIPNGVEIPTLTDTDETLIKFGLQKKRYILTVGRFVPEKGFDYLIDAFNEGDFENWKLVIVGEADHKDEYCRDLKIKASKNSNVVLTGFLTGQPLEELYSHAGLFVLSSYYEGLPIVLLEAMSYGLSCIASDIKANRNVDLYEDRFFRAGDIEALTMKIREFIHKPWGEDNKENQKKMIFKKYNWEDIANKTMNVYRQIVF